MLRSYWSEFIDRRKLSAEVERLKKDALTGSGWSVGFEGSLELKEELEVTSLRGTPEISGEDGWNSEGSLKA